MHLNLPNLLTLLRIALIPVVVAAFYFPHPAGRSVAAALFLLCGFTDWLDGHLARRLGQTSALGAFLDPVADKLLVATVLILLVERHPTPWLAVCAAVVVGREITVSALREWMAGVGARTQVAVGRLGKVKTALQMTALVLLLAGGPWWTPGFVLLQVAVLLTLWSMCLYLGAAWPQLRGAGDGPTAGP